MLLQKNEYSITLETEVPKILKISAALNNTYVFITTCKSSQNEEKLVHINEQGKVLWEKAYKQSIDTFSMFNYRDVIVLNVAEGKIDIIDLQSYKIRSYPHQFTFEDTSYMQLYAFYDTRFLCVQETGNIGNGKLILTYYRYSSNQLEKVSEFKSKEGEWAYGQNIAKANNHSKIAWWRSSFTEQIEFHYFDLKVNPNGHLSTIKCRNNLPALVRSQNITVCIGLLWQSAPDIYMFVCNTTGFRLGAFRKIMVIDSISGILRESHLKGEQLYNHSVSVLDFVNLGPFSVIFTQNMVAGKAQDSLIYYIDNEKQKVITTQSWKATNRSHYSTTGSDPNAIIEAIHANGNVKEIKYLSKRLVTISEMYLHFLLHVNEDFDDDLLQDALEIMGMI